MGHTASRAWEIMEGRGAHVEPIRMSPSSEEGVIPNPRNPGAPPK